MKLFGTDGIRGRANEFPITPELILHVGQAVGQVLHNHGLRGNRVVIGKDTRISGYLLETALTSGLVSTGMSVYLPGPMPTPAIAHLTKSMGCSAGVMITASHNPFEDNGLKIFGPDGYKLNDELEERIEQHILGEKSDRYTVQAAGIGKAYRIEDARGRYIEFAKYTVDNISLRGLKIVVDCGHGAAYFIAPLIFKELGAEVIKTGCNPDGININDSCGALHAEHAAKLVKAHGADLGLSFDGDADRVIFTDAEGNTISGDRILASIALGLKAQGKLRDNTMAVTIMSNWGLHETMKQNGIKVLSTDVGDRHIIQTLRERGLNFGGENSGHIIFSDYATTGDGIIAALQVLALMKRNKQSLAEMTNCIHEFPQKLINLPVKSKPPLDTLPKLSKLCQQANAEFGESGRQLIRYSGTEKKIRILLEHRDSATVEKWAKQFIRTIQEELGS